MSKLYTIIGGGIGGLTTALAFEKKGIPYQVFEKAPVISEVGAGIWLAPNALQVFESLGVLSDIQAKGNVINRITLAKADLSPLSDNFQDEIVDKFGFSTVAIHRAELQKMLIGKIPSDKLFLGKAFKSSEQLQNDRIKILFEDNTTHETDFIIGADGINSKLRNQLSPNSKIRSSGQTCWRGIANHKLEKEYEHRGMELWGNQIRFGISKIAKGKVYWFAVALKQSIQETTLSKDELIDMYQHFHPLVNQLISETPEDKILNNDLLDLELLDHWHKGNICLIGDACHATTPNMGQGAAQAIEDAHYLSNCIADTSVENPFILFQQKRKSKVETIVKQSWTTGKIAHWKHGRSLRNTILKSLPKKILLKKMIELYQIEKQF